MKNIGIGTMALIFMLVISAYFIGVKYSQTEEYAGDYKTYTICPDDTLWGIAQDIDGDTRYIVYVICEDNDIEECDNLQIGQQIKLRVEY